MMANSLWTTSLLVLGLGAWRTTPSALAFTTRGLAPRVSRGPSPVTTPSIREARRIVLSVEKLGETNFGDLVEEYVEAAKKSVGALQQEDASAQALFAGQLALGASGGPRRQWLLLIGVIPVVGDVLEFVAGPGLVVGGAALTVTGLLERRPESGASLGRASIREVAVIAQRSPRLGPANLTPTATPVEGNALKTNGAYALSRHPIYTGLLLFATGLSITTDSFQRLIITGLLYFLLDYKASKEEDALLKLHPAYPAYQSTVPKLLPDLKTLLKQDDYLAPDDDE